jgi:hypothetical protein
VVGQTRSARVRRCRPVGQRTTNDHCGISA